MMSRTTRFNPMFPGMAGPGFGCPRPQCPTIVQKCPPIVSCSKQTLEQYHITKQPYIHNFHTEVVHHHILENEFIPQYSCSEVHVNQPPRPMTFGPAPMMPGQVAPAPFMPGPAMQTPTSTPNIPGTPGVMPLAPGPMMF